jgi:hypothetical protein
MIKKLINPARGECFNSAQHKLQPPLILSLSKGYAKAWSNPCGNLKKLFLLIACIASCLSLQARRYNRNCGAAGYGYVGVNIGMSLPLGGVYYADGPQGSNPYYGTPVNYGGFPAPYGYAAYAGPVVYWGW